MKHYINNGKAYSYTYDEAGNIKTIQSPNGDTVSYEYDSLNQLKKETYSAALPFASLVEGGGTANAVTEGVSYDTIEYTYDTRGNITAKTFLLGDTTVANVPYTYTDTTWKDRLTSYNGVTITADAIGNPLSWHDGSAMTWRRGRQLATYAKNGITTIYSYNDDGIRTSKKVGANATVNYSVVDGTLRRMTDGTNTLQFVYGNGLSSVIFNGVEYWYVFNAQGDVIGLINASGSYVVEYTYDAWGKPLSKTGSLADTLGTFNPFRYRGYIYDEETGFYYCQSRYYDPEVGRFINSDNEALVTATPESASWDKNLYAYCDNNPIVRADDNGEFWHIVAGAVVGGVVGLVSSLTSELIEDGNISGRDIAKIAVSTALGIAEGALVAAVPSAAVLISTASSVAETAINGAINGDSAEKIVVDSIFAGAMGAISGSAGNDFVKGSKLINSAGDSIGNAVKKGVHPMVKKTAKKTIKKAGRYIAKTYVCQQVGDLAYGGISQFSSFCTTSIIKRI